MNATVIITDKSGKVVRTARIPLTDLASLAVELNENVELVPTKEEQEEIDYSTKSVFDEVF